MDNNWNVPAHIFKTLQFRIAVAFVLSACGELPRSPEIRHDGPLDRRIADVVGHDATARESQGGLTDMSHCDSIHLDLGWLNDEPDGPNLELLTDSETVCCGDADTDHIEGGAPGEVSWDTADVADCGENQCDCIPDCTYKKLGQDDGCGAQCVFGGQLLEVTLDVLWCGWYVDTSNALKELMEDADVGPSVEVDQGQILLSWCGVVYMDCMEPDFFYVTQDGTVLDVVLVNTDCDPLSSLDSPMECSCTDTDVIANASGVLPVPPGQYSVTMSCEVYGDGGGSPGAVETFHVDVE